MCLFVEMIRKPQAFIAALEKAQEMGVAVIACKVDRSEKSAAFAQTHSGALVGNDSAYQAVFERYGVTRVHSIDEMANTLSLFTADRQPRAGGLSMVIDSGGERELGDFFAPRPESAVLLVAEGVRAGRRGPP